MFFGILNLHFNWLRSQIERVRENVIRSSLKVRIVNGRSEWVRVHSCWLWVLVLVLVLVLVVIAVVGVVGVVVIAVVAVFVAFAVVAQVVIEEIVLCFKPSRSAHLKYKSYKMTADKHTRIKLNERWSSAAIFIVSVGVSVGYLNVSIHLWQLLPS